MSYRDNSADGSFILVMAVGIGLFVCMGTPKEQHRATVQPAVIETQSNPVPTRQQIAPAAQTGAVPQTVTAAQPKATEGKAPVARKSVLAKPLAIISTLILLNRLTSPKRDCHWSRRGHCSPYRNKRYWRR